MDRQSLVAFLDELEKISAVRQLPYGLEKLAAQDPELFYKLLKEAGGLEYLGKLMQRRGAPAIAKAARKTGRAAKDVHTRAQVAAGNVMSGSHGHGLSHAAEKIPTGSTTKMVMGYASDPHVQRAAAKHVVGAGKVVGRGVKKVVGKLRPAPQPALAMV